ncbi:MAG: Smr/MutS family protein [Bdellovibrionales bacterium]|nr:Smr/MutS family protein [Bdellovibrionales bacterium]
MANPAQSPKVFVDLDWLQIQQKIQSYATSELGKQVLSELKPLASAEEAKTHFQKLQEFRSVLIMGQRAHMESIDLFNLWFQRLKKDAVLKTLELKDVRHFCMEAVALKEILKQQKQTWIYSLEQRIMEAIEPLSAIDQIMTPDGEIRTDASETLYKLYREKSNQAQSIQQTLDRLVRQHNMDTVLQEKYVTTREGRWVLPVKGGMQHHFEGLIHSTSQTKQTVFMEPKEVIPLNNRLRQVEIEIEEEIERILSQLSLYLSQRKAEFSETKEVLLECDVLFSQALLANHLEAHPPEFVQNQMELLGLRHPLLIYNQHNHSEKKQPIVSNDVRMDDQSRILLLSGPNAGGKTVLLKSIGLAAHMARCGLFICAEEGSKLPFFEEIHVAVGDSQNIDAQLSTFAAHLKILNGASYVHGNNHLLLIDEICGSTDPEEGTALARSFIKTYASNHVFGVITSHLGPLKLGWEKNSGVTNGSLEYDTVSGKPTYHFLMGVPGQSLAIQTAKRVGVQDPIIEQALQMLSPDHQKYQQGLAELESTKTELRELKEKLRHETQAMQKEKLKFQKLNEKFHQEKDQMIHQVTRRAEKKIDRLIENTKVEQVFRRHEKLSQTKFDLPEIIKSSHKPTTTARIETAEDFAKAFPPSSKVFAPSLGRDAVVQGIPNARGEVPILSQSMRLLIPWQQLKMAQNTTNPTVEVLRKSKNINSNYLEGIRVVDLRGLRSEEALTQLETQLDKALLNSEDRFKIIHGNGTESLKRSVRSYLSRNVHVKKWKVGGPDGGGDGITWVEI